MAKEEVILDLNVDQGSMITELERTKKAIIQLKEEQQKLTKAYKDGNVTVEEYASESVRLEAILKKEQSTYNNTQKAVTGVKTKMDELIISNNKLASSVKQSTENIRIGGVTVGELGTKLTALANPVTAAVAVVGALGTAYARSTIGARDLAFASNQLSAAFTITTNAFASLISSSEDGEGFLSKFTNRLLFQVSPALAILSQQAAIAQEKIEDLQRNEVISRGEANERLAENQELMTKIQDSQTDINEKLHSTSQVIINLRQNEDELLKIKQEQLAEINKQLAADSTNEKILDAQALKIQEISVIKRDTERKVEAIQRLESNILDTENKKAEALKKQREETEKRIKSQDEATAREFEGRQVSFSDDPTAASFDPQEQFEKDAELINAELGLVLTSEELKRNELLKTNAVKQMIADEDFVRMQEELAMTESMLGQAAQLFSDNTVAGKLLSIATATINTYRGATLALAELPPPFSFIQSALTIATGLASVARIGGVPTSFASGGFTGIGGKYQPAGVVHKGEVVWSQADVAMAGGAGRVDRMRPTYPNRSKYSGYADGGLVNGSVSMEINQSLLMANAIKNMPIPELSVKEVTKVQRRISVKERVSRA